MDVDCLLVGETELEELEEDEDSVRDATNATPNTPRTIIASTTTLPDFELKFT